MAIWRDRESEYKYDVVDMCEAGGSWGVDALRAESLQLGKVSNSPTPWDWDHDYNHDTFGVHVQS